MFLIHYPLIFTIMKKLVFSLVCLCFLTFSIAQTETEAPTVTTIGLTPFGHAYGVNNTHAQRIYNHIAKLLSCNTESIKLVDRSVWGTLTQERDRQDDIDFRNSETYEQGKSAGAEALVRGYVYEARQDWTETGEEKVIIKIGLSIIDITTAETIAMQDFSVQGVSIEGKLKTTNQVIDKDGNIITRIVEDAFVLMNTLLGKKKDAFDAGITSLDEDLKAFFGAYYPGSYKCQKINLETLTKVFSKPDPLHFSFFVLNDKEIAIQAKKENLPSKLISQLSLVAETPYELSSTNGETMSGTDRQEVAKFKVSEYRGDRTILKVKGGKKSIKEMIAEAKSLIEQDPQFTGEPKFYIMPTKDLAD